MADNVTQKQKVFWNMMGSLCNALSSMILAIIVNRVIGGNAGGIFAFAFSNAQLMYTLGGFEIRPLQSTDVEEKFSFSDYFSLRMVTCLVMMIATTIYVGVSGFDRLKALTIWVVCLYKMVEAVSDVFAGMFQQHDRIDLSGKTSTFRPTLSTITFAVVLIVSRNLVYAALSMVVASAVLFFAYDLRLRKKFSDIVCRFETANMGSLIVEAAPLFVAAFINMYINNAPKYAINRNFSDEVQNYYNIIFMPAFVINLFSLFAFRPLLTELARDWNDKNMKPFIKIVRNILLWILLLTVVCMAGAYLIGAQILGLVYGTSIIHLRKELAIVMFAGGISATATFLYYVITVMRKQKLLMAGYALGFVCSLVLPAVLVPKFELMGAVISCGISMAVLAVTFSCIVAYQIAHNRE